METLRSLVESWPRLRWTDAVDVGLVAFLAWAVLAYLRRTRSRLALLGLVFLAGIYLAARKLELQLTAWILQGFFAVVVLVLVVVFQDDLRRFFEQIAVWGLRRRADALPSDAVDVLVRAVAQQVKTRTGALYVIPGRQLLDAHVEGGVALDARISEPLLLSLFDAHSPGHDGAVIVSGAQVARFAVHLPLSTNHGEVGRGGTRHAAALGLSERCDALCVVVSEERGTVSVARGGTLRTLASPERLTGEVRAFLDAVAEPRRPAPRHLLARWPEMAGALLFAVVLWAVLVPGSHVVETTRTARVVVENLPEGYRLLAIEPAEVAVTVSGPRRYLPDSSDLKIVVDAVLVELGRRTFRLTPAQVEHPPRVTVVGCDPDRVKVSVEEVEDTP